MSIPVVIGFSFRREARGGGQLRRWDSNMKLNCLVRKEIFEESFGGYFAAVSTPIFAGKCYGVVGKLSIYKTDTLLHKSKVKVATKVIHLY